MRKAFCIKRISVQHHFTFKPLNVLFDLLICRKVERYRKRVGDIERDIEWTKEELSGNWKRCAK